MKKNRRKEKGASLIPAQPSKAAAQVHPRTRTLSPAFGPWAAQRPGPRVLSPLPISLSGAYGPHGSALLPLFSHRQLGPSYQPSPTLRREEARFVRVGNRIPTPNLTRFGTIWGYRCPIKCKGVPYYPWLLPGCAALIPSRHEREFRILPSKAPPATEARPPCSFSVRAKSLGGFVSFFSISPCIRFGF